MIGLGIDIGLGMGTDGRPMQSSPSASRSPSSSPSASVSPSSSPSASISPSASASASVSPSASRSPSASISASISPSASRSPSSSASPSASLPSFTSPALVVGLHNYNPVGYPAGAAFDAGNSGGGFVSATFAGVAPYPADYAQFIIDAPAPPYLVFSWRDQNLNANDLMQVVDAKQPTLDATLKEIQFNGSSTGLATAANVTLGGQTLTCYLRFKAGSLAETSVVFETGSGASANKGAISIRMVAGVLTVSVSDQTNTVALLNTKVKTISDANWHLLSVTIDTTNGTAANQVLCWLDGSSSGWTSSVSTDLASENLTTSKFNVGARNNAASTFFTGSMTDLLTFTVLHNDTLRGQWESDITANNA